jgi:hypothetical protein
MAKRTSARGRPRGRGRRSAADGAASATRADASVSIQSSTGTLEMPPGVGAEGAAAEPEATDEPEHEDGLDVPKSDEDFGIRPDRSIDRQSMAGFEIVETRIPDLPDKAPERRRYQLRIARREGLYPRQSINLGGSKNGVRVNIRPVTTDYRSDPPTVFPGVIAELSREEFDAIVEDGSQHVVRWKRARPKKGQARGKLLRAQVYHVNDRLYRPQRGDEPLMDYIAIKDLGPAEPVGKRRLAPDEIDDVERLRKQREAHRVAADERERRARKDPRDARRRAEHARAREEGREVSGTPE